LGRRPRVTGVRTSYPRLTRSCAIIPAGDVFMCLAAPARVISVWDKTAVVDYQGVQTTARLDTLSEPVAVGDYVLVHTGFAIRRLTAEDAEETLRLFDELSQSLAAEGPPQPGSDRANQLTQSVTTKGSPGEQGSARSSQVTPSAATEGSPEQQGSARPSQLTQSATIQGPPAEQGSDHPNQVTRSATTQASRGRQGGRGR
jgi:hydrogenase expression/formation protein HypC